MVAATPPILALYDEDISDAFEYLGLGFSRLPYWQHLLSSTGAAYAGYGLGLCKNYKDADGCWRESKAMPIETIMAVTFTDDAMIVTLSRIQSVIWLWEPSYRRHVDWALGLSRLESGDIEEKVYWSMVKEGLEQIMLDRPTFPKPEKVLLMGDRANDTRFLEALDVVLKERLTEGKMPDIYGEDAAFVAAKGAAEMAKRSPYDLRLLSDEESELWQMELAEQKRMSQLEDERTQFSAKHGTGSRHDTKIDL